MRRAVGAAMARPSRTSSGQHIRIVTYNVLSSSLAAPSYFSKCDPEDLDADNRLTRLKRALLEEMRACPERNGGRGAVLCLQEVSKKWLYVLTAL